MSYDADLLASHKSSDWLTPEDECRSNPKQKQLGAFYTPTALSDLLVDWAVRRGDEKILEPGFGGCGFIESAQRRLRDLSTQAPVKQIFGCDIDDVAYRFLSRVMPDSRIELQFPQLDFMSARPGTTWHEEFDVVVGNPPYVAYQLIPTVDRHAYQDRLKASGFLDVSARASLWAYFVLHAITFLKLGGRVAWVLPGSFLQANYARPVRDHLERLFERTYVCRVHERLFVKSGADEETVVLLADGYGTKEGKGEVTYAQVANLGQLAAAIESWRICKAKTETTAQSCVSVARNVPNDLLPRPRGDIPARRLGDVVRVKIGIVTGDNDFFALSTKQAESLGIETRHLVPLLSKFAMAPGARLTASDMANAAKTAAKCWLVTPKELPSGIESVDQYLLAYPQTKIETVATFKKRVLWHCADDRRPPDAFWPVMRDVGPRIVMNEAQVNCTNTIHRVYALPKTSSTDMLIAFVGILSTMGQLSAEMRGRHYGSGVLKHEPRDVEAIEIPWIEIADKRSLKRLVQSIDRLLRNDDFDGARQAADEYLIDELPHMTSNYVRNMERALLTIRSRRMPQVRRA